MAAHPEPASTPLPPYYAVIFTSERTVADDVGYQAMAARMVGLAAEQPGFLGMESARDGLGITVSYWRDLASIRAWQAHGEHLVAQQLGRERWYRWFRLRIARVEAERGFQAP